MSTSGLGLTGRNFGRIHAFHPKCACPLPRPAPAQPQLLGRCRYWHQSRQPHSHCYSHRRSSGRCFLRSLMATLPQPPPPRPSWPLPQSRTSWHRHCPYLCHRRHPQETHCSSGRRRCRHRDRCRLCHGCRRCRSCYSHRHSSGRRFLRSLLVTLPQPPPPRPLRPLPQPRAPWHCHCPHH